MPPIEKGGHIALLLFVGLLVGLYVLSVHQQFLFIFFAEVAHSEIKYGIIWIHHKNI
jgi:hypothetical protein